MHEFIVEAEDRHDHASINTALYGELLAGTERADISEVYRTLQEASQQRHLPAFRRCAGRSDNTGDVRGDLTPGHPDDGLRRRRRRWRGGVSRE